MLRSGGVIFYLQFWLVFKQEMQITRLIIIATSILIATPRMNETGYYTYRLLTSTTLCYKRKTKIKNIILFTIVSTTFFSHIARVCVCLSWYGRDGYLFTILQYNVQLRGFKLQSSSRLSLAAATACTHTLNHYIFPIKHYRKTHVILVINIGIAFIRYATLCALMIRHIIIYT